MESESILQFLENKTILVTGSTGLLGKALVEKILRVQPNVKKLYLLLRASDSNSANQRMHSEVYIYYLLIVQNYVFLIIFLYDVSLATNTSGVLNVLNFAKKCVELKLLLHVSTDFDMEKKLVEEKLNKLQTEGAAEATVTRTMRDFGMERAKLFGWPNAYVFSKAMGEMCLLEQSRDNLPVVIIRPTMITSTYKEPFAGWIEGLRYHY
ncbi:hypothetical protein UlMin_012227, partial [Ulmus minor]